MMINRKEAEKYILKVTSVGDSGNPLLLNLEFNLLTEDENIIDIYIGRSSSNDICLSDLSVSKVHASISYYDGDGFYLKDENSKHGTFFNSKKLKFNDNNTQGNLFRLVDGNIIRFGRIICVITYKLQQTKTMISNSIQTKNIIQIEQFNTRKEKRKRTPAKNRQMFNKSYKIDINKYDDNGMLINSSLATKTTTIPSQSDINFDNPERSLDGMEIGENILQKLGWKKGNKLGKESNLPANEPIQVVQRISRAGLGLNNSTFEIIENSNNNNYNIEQNLKFYRQYQNQKRYNDSVRNFEKILDF